MLKLDPNMTGATAASPWTTLMRRAHPAPVVLLASSFAFRIPPLLNARSTNSDAAVVGLQAMHMLGGEWSPFLWGSGYQTAADSVVAALFFAALGPAPWVLMFSALCLHVTSTFLVFATVRRRFGAWLSCLMTMPLVVSPSSVHSYALYPPRQLSLTLAMTALWAVDRGAALLIHGAPSTSAHRGLRWLGAGGALGTLAIAADPYPMVLLPVLCVYAASIVRKSPWPMRAFGVFGASASVGLVPFGILHQLVGAKSGPMGLTLSAIPHHARLLWDVCLPWALSYGVFYARDVMDYRVWDAPSWFRVLGAAGALLLAGFVLFGLVSPRRRELSPAVTYLGFAGALTFPIAIAAFLVSIMVMDAFSTRYLAVLTLMTPFAVMPAASALGGRKFALAFAPHVLASAVAGWVGYGPFVQGPLPVAETAELRDDYALFAELRRRDVRYATADYWTSYRLTYLFREKIVVVPTNSREDRYAPYRGAFENQPIFAYIFDPGRSREDVATVEQTLRAAYGNVEQLAAGRLQVFLVTRARSHLSFMGRRD